MRRILCALCFALLCGLSARSQEAQVTGLITDPTGAVVPQASINLRNQDTGVKYRTDSNGAGIYTFPFVKPGPYEVTVEKTGFKTVNRTNIKIDVSQNARIDITLEIGQTTQVVEVKANAPLVNTSDGTVSDVVTSSQVDNLTLNGRNLLEILALAPGAAPAQGADLSHLGHMGASASVDFNGVRTGFINMEFDGGNNSDEGSGGNGGNVTFALDSIAEIRVSTSNYGADMGQHGGTDIQVATKSGTKDFHGNAHEFVRNDIMDANGWFLNQQIAPPGGNAPKQPLKWNLFGYNFGGPFYIPGHYNTDKSKTFFFWSEEWAKYREGSIISAGAPSLRMRQGDFSECDPTSANANQVIISQGCVLPTINGHTVDTVSVNPNGKALLNGLIPLPNNGVDGYLTAPDLPTNYREESIRVDQNISEKTALFVRFTKDSWNTVMAPSTWSSAVYDTIVTNWNNPAVAEVLHLTHTFKPNLMNEFIIGYSDAPHFMLAGLGPSNVAQSLNKPSTWTGNTLFAVNANQPVLPGASICGGVPFCVAEGWGYAPFINANPVYTMKENVVATFGKHMLKFGALALWNQRNQMSGGAMYPSQGMYTFSNSSPISTGNGLADMFVGNIAQYTEGAVTSNGVAVGGYGKSHWRATQIEPYFQDDWKVAKRLTLNLGVRWQFIQPLHEFSNPRLDSTFIPSQYNPAVEALLDSSGNLVLNPATGNVHDFTTPGNGLVICGSSPAVLSGCQERHWGTVGPRFGFAYDPRGTGKTAIRGGYGIYYDPGNVNEATAQALRGNPPAYLVPSGYNITGYQNIVAGAFGPPNIKAMGYTDKFTAIQQYSLSVEHEFSGNNLLSVGYVGTLGHHLGLSGGRNLNQVSTGLGTENVPALAGQSGCDAQGNCNVQNALINQEQSPIFFVPFRGYSTITYFETTENSNYNALQAKLRHTTSHGLTLQGSYTWSHTLDAPPGGGIGYYSDPSRWYGTSSLNISNMLVLNYVYELPFFKHTSSATLRNALGGWALSGITSFMSGYPVDFSCGVNGYQSGIGGGVRCNTVGPLKIDKGTVNDSQFGPMRTWFNPAVVTQPNLSQLSANNQPGMFGYMGSNVLTGPGTNNWDMTLQKNIALPWVNGEHSNLQFRLETFNTFNHPQWNSINAGCSGSIGFGQPCTQLGNGEVNGARSPRLIQMGMKFTF